MNNLLEAHDLKDSPKTIKYISRIASIKQVQQNKWNFYGVARKSVEGFKYEIPRINVMFCTTSIKDICVATVFVPKKNLLAASYFLN